MTALFLQVDSVLRGRSPSERISSDASRATLAFLLIACGLIYGGVMGSYGGLSGDRVWQVGYSATKVPLMLLATFCLSLPSFFVLNTLAGLRSDFADSVRALLAAQAAVTVVLASLAPLTLVWYISVDVYEAAILFNGGMFAVATIGGQIVLRREYRRLVRRNSRHRAMLFAWMIVYIFTGIQMGWSLRPFIGDPISPVQFFRSGHTANAYVVVARLIRDHVLPWG
jgi:hypothetical protein